MPVIVRLTYAPDMQGRLPVYSATGTVYRAMRVLDTEIQGGKKIWIVEAKSEEEIS